MAELGYRDLVTFHSTDETGSAVYHTNVMMAIGSDVAVVCAEAVPDAKERRHLLASLRRHHEVRTLCGACSVHFVLCAGSCRHRSIVSSGQ